MDGGSGGIWRVSVIAVLDRLETTVSFDIYLIASPHFVR